MMRVGWPQTLFGRLALLLSMAVLASHVLVLSLLFEFPPGGPGGPGKPPPFTDIAPPHGPPPPGTSAMPHSGQPPPPGRSGSALEHPGLWLDIGLRLGALLIAAWVGARWLAAPVRALARAAHELGDNIDRPPLEETGTAECREATRVFNRMQQRIREQMLERERFVAAMSHDLRTPLTRLRLRSETLTDDKQRQAICRDVAEMESMLAATLDYLRGAVVPEPMAKVDIEALVHSLADDATDSGHHVSVSGEARPIQGQPKALRRCLDNLVSNAIRYGQQAHIQLRDSGDALTIEVQDQGPGLPEGEHHKVLQPFYRVDSSRHPKHGGVGLGLTIANEIARRHGHPLHLANGPQGGLCVTLRLPRNGPVPTGTANSASS